MCNDGSPPLPRPNTSLSLRTRDVIARLYIDEPEEAQLWSELDLPIADLQRLLSRQTWLADADEAAWQPLFSEIRKMEQAMVLPSDGLIRKLSDSENDGLSELYISAGTPTTDGWCPGIELDREMLWPTYDRDFAHLHALVEDVCFTEWRYRMTVMGLSQNNNAGFIDTAGWDTKGFRDGLVRRGSSVSLYFWAKTIDLEGGTAPLIAGLDSNNNICFAIRGTRAILQEYGLVSEYQAYLSERNNGTNLSDVTMNGRWSQGRIYIDHMTRDRDVLVDSEWNFFALSVDADRGTLRFAINGMVQRTAIQGSMEDWGCDSLQYVVMAGSEMVVSPIRIGSFALTRGSLQRLYHTTRTDFLNTFTGEDQSLLQRREKVDRPVKQFNSRMVALSPPLVLQRRADAELDGHNCSGETTAAVNRQVEKFHRAKCSPPYKCEDEVPKIECPAEGSPSPERFFGQNQVTVAGATYIPEFAWTLEGDLIVRDGKEISPREEFIDFYTQEVELWMLLFVPASQVASFVRARFDLSSIRVQASVKFLQIKVLEGHEFVVVIGWTITGIIMALVGMVLAMPAAMQELSEARNKNMKWVKALLNRVNPSFSHVHSLKLRKYSFNTSQPDLLDVVFNIGMLALMIAFLANQVTNRDAAGKALSEVADIDWGGEDSFDDKVYIFIKDIERIMRLVQVESMFVSISFWLLLVCCVRLMIYLKVHPKIASVTETFESTASELLNFLISFGMIYVFLAFTANVRFGYQYDEFSTLTQSLITLFSILIGDTTPDYYNDLMLCLFVVGYVFICSFSLLNFLLAIVVNGYTKVTEKVLENEIAQSIIADVFTVVYDVWLWNLHRTWPSKLKLLSVMQDHYPDVFGDEEEILVALDRRTFQSIVSEATKGRATAKEADSMFTHYLAFPVLVLVKGDPEKGEEELVAPGRALHKSHSALSIVLHKTRSTRRSTDMHPMRRSTDGVPSHYAGNRRSAAAENQW
eukprot:CAMPEP_0177607570 /NCGR_PEP_ID=MMETSP0419_2-20121207/17990_1 /TAXON_ID=582737 /ORGANISM="Tetraselmis sp., Strain GSL018" /LENGTH=978 /DNA_ID=CAMNT_0019102165 /DNA_START=848 /DNA_END=3781 /DNA_ORIENTATION=-